MNNFTKEQPKIPTLILLTLVLCFMFIAAFFFNRNSNLPAAGVSDTNLLEKPIENEILEKKTVPQFNDKTDDTKSSKSLNIENETATNGESEDTSEETEEKTENYSDTTSYNENEDEDEDEEDENNQNTEDLTQVYVTFYGWPDNDPPGRAIAYPSSRYSETIHTKAGGIGSYEDPITFASDPNLFKQGTIIYVPYLKKYIIMEDMCATCIQNWKNRQKKHIDIWLESDENFINNVYRCQNKLTRPSIGVEIDPTPDKEVNTRPLFDIETGECL